MLAKIKGFNFTRVSLTIIVICSLATFWGVFQILKRHQYIIGIGAKTDLNMVSIIQDLEGEDTNCQNRLKIIELENKIFKEQLETLFEFHEGEDSKAILKE